MADQESRHRPPDSWFAALVDNATDVIAALDDKARFRYINDAAQLWLGFEPDEWIGRNALDLIHPDDQIRAIESLGFTHSFDEPTAPAPFRLAHADGHWVTMDVGGRVLPGRDAIDAAGTTDTDFAEDENLVVLICREASNADLADRVLEALATGAPFEHTLLLVARTIQHPLWGFRLAMYVRDDDGDEQVVDTDAPLPPIGIDLDEELPWDVARRTGEQIVHVGIEDLPPGLRAEAAAFDMQACWAVPVLDPLFNKYACLVVWATYPVEPNLGQGVALSRVTRLFGLALRERQQRVQLERAARRDLITGLPNRTRFFHVLETELAARTDRPDRLPAVLFIDLDGFKAVNDEHGHATGDVVLQAVGGRLVRHSPEAAVVSRIGGDEFAVVVDTDGSPIEAIRLAEDLIAAISAPLMINDTLFDIGASIGIALASPDHQTAESVLAAADQAMYRSKRSGKGRWAVARSDTA